MNIDFELYRIFFVVANNGNITKASMILNISQPAVSKSIKKLEEQLGGQLFVRTKRGVTLTKEGKVFYDYIKKAMEYISNAENKFTYFQKLDEGTIRIGISTTLTKDFLLPYLEKFHITYPKINIQIITNVSSELFKKLRNGLIDLVILNSSDNKFDSDLDVIKCKKTNDCFIVSDKYVSKKINTSIKDLNRYQLILQTKGSNTRKFIDDFAQKHGVVLKPNMSLASHQLVIEFTKIGLGIGYATKDFIKKELECGSLKEVNLKEKLPQRYICIVTSKNNMPNFSSKKLIDIILKN